MPDVNLRELLRRHYPLIEAVVTECLRRSTWESRFEHDELANSAILALHQAATTYDPSKGTFEGYARRRLRGTVLMTMIQGFTASPGFSRAPYRTEERPQRVSLQAIDRELRSEESSTSSELKLLLANLDDQNRQIVIQSFGLDGQPMRSDAEIGKVLNLSANEVVQRRMAAIAHMKLWAE